jgi:hypothetical protein
MVRPWSDNVSFVCHAPRYDNTKPLTLRTQRAKATAARHVMGTPVPWSKQRNHVFAQRAHVAAEMAEISPRAFECRTVACLTCDVIIFAAAHVCATKRLQSAIQGGSRTPPRNDPHLARERFTSCRMDAVSGSLPIERRGRVRCVACMTLACCEHAVLAFVHQFSVGRSADTPGRRSSHAQPVGSG